MNENCQKTIKDTLKKFKKQLGISRQKISGDVLVKIYSFLNNVDNGNIKFANQIQKNVVLDFCNFVETNDKTSIDAFIKNSSKFGKQCYKIHNDKIHEQDIILEHFLNGIYYLVWKGRIKTKAFVKFDNLDDLNSFIKKLNDYFLELENSYDNIIENECDYFDSDDEDEECFATDKVENCEEDYNNIINNIINEINKKKNKIKSKLKKTN